MADIVTPNVKEAAALLGDGIMKSVYDMPTATKLLHDLQQRKRKFHAKNQHVQQPEWDPTQDKWLVDLVTLAAGQQGTLAAGQQGAFSTGGANKSSGANKPPLKTVKGWEMVADLFNAQMFPPDMQQHHFKATHMSCRLMFLKKQFEKVKIKPEGYGPEFLDSLKQLFKKHKLTIPQIMLDHGDEMERPSYKSPKRTPSGSSGRYKPYPRANSPYPGVNYTTPSSAATTSNACHACQPRNKIRDECSKILVSQEMNFDIIHSIMERITSEEMKKLIDCPVEHKTYFAQQLEQIYATPH